MPVGRMIDDMFGSALILRHDSGYYANGKLDVGCGWVNRPVYASSRKCPGWAGLQPNSLSLWAQSVE